jgi:hypothetical protein
MNRQPRVSSKLQNRQQQTSGDIDQYSECDEKLATWSTADKPTPINEQLCLESNIKHKFQTSASNEVDVFYSWIIVAASFVNCCIVGIMFIGFSILYIAFDEHFKTTKAVSGWIGSLFLATGNICGEY